MTQPSQRYNMQRNRTVLTGSVWRLLSSGALLSALSLFVWAHEGHKALPTKGARVDGDTVFLSFEAHKAVGLATSEVDLKDLENTITVTATVVAPWKQHAYASTRVGGKLERVYFRPGDVVQAGQRLADIESMELENEQLELIQSKLELELAQHTLDRAESLGTRGIVAERDVRAAQTIRLEKSSLFEVTKRKLIGLGLSSDTIEEVLRTEQPERMLPVLSPAGGVIVHGDANPGRIVEPTEHLFEILDLSTVWVEAMVLEAAAYRVRRHLPARVMLTGRPGQVFEGQIDYVALQVDATSRAVPVLIALANSDPENPSLRPGMFGRVQIVTEQVQQKVVCPTNALVTAGAETYVFVQQKAPTKDKPGEYIRRHVLLGLRARDWVEVKEGLFPGDEVVTRGSHELSSFFVQGVLTLTLEAQRNTRLRLEPVEERAIEDVVTVNGAVEVPPARKAFASSRIPGRIARILVDLSQPVQAGQQVAEVESLQFQSLQLELIQTRTQLNQIKDVLQRARKLKTVIAEQEVLMRETELRKAENQLNGLKRKLQAIGLSESDVTAIADQGKLFEVLPVRSPIDGYMVHFDVIPGQVVKAENPLFEIHDMSKVWVRGYVFENDMPKVRLDQPVRIRLASDPAFVATATLLRTNYVLNATERVMSVWAELDNEWVESGERRAESQQSRETVGASDPQPSALRSQPRLKDNMLARLTISASASPPVPAVPIAALLNEGSDTYVFVKKPDKKSFFDRRQVEIGRRDDRYAEIKRGVLPGELVAVGGVQQLRTAYVSVR
jgi:RND family efflux transporter MFP subunit